MNIQDYKNSEKLVESVLVNGKRGDEFCSLTERRYSWLTRR
jgi:hypothetical protein